MEKHFPETRRFADRWAINQIAYQYGIQRNYHRRTERDFRPDSKAEDNVPAGSIPYSIPTYKVPMKDIRQALGYDKKRWNYLRVRRDVLTYPCGLYELTVPIMLDVRKRKFRRRI